MNRIALNFELPAASEAQQLPDWLLLVPAGRFKGRDGRTFINDRPSAVLSFQVSLNRDIAFDFEHATELKAPKGEEAPATGWIKPVEMQVREGAIYGRVGWTVLGQDAVGNKKYRYYSPALICDRDDRVVGIASVALTNKHNLQLPALNHQSTTTEDDMSLSTAIRQALGLKDDANEAEAVFAIGKLKDEHRVALNAQQNPPLDKWVPRADHDQALSTITELRTELNTQKTAQLETEITELVDGAIKAKKIAPASRDHYVALCRQSGTIEHVKSILDKTPALLGESGLDDKPLEKNRVELNSEQQKINAMFGNSVEDIDKFGK